MTVAGSTSHYHGTGYHDHNWGNAPLPMVLDHWYWGRAKLGPYTVISCYLTSTKQFGATDLPIFLVAKGEQVLCENEEKVDFTASQPVLSPATKKHYHQQLVYDYQDDQYHFKIGYRVADRLAGFSLMEDEGQKPGLLTKLGTWLMGMAPTYDRFSGPATLERYEGSQVTETYEAPAAWERMSFYQEKEG